MLVAPKSVEAAFTLQNDHVRFDIANGDDGFNWIGIAAAMLQGDTSSRMLFNVAHMWEIVLVEMDEDIRGESYKVVNPSGVSATVESEEDDDRAILRITWADIVVDGQVGEAGRDKLKVVVELELRPDERFLRGRIRAFWTASGPSTSASPGRYAIWRVRFPVVDLTPTFSNAFSDAADIESEDALFVPENHGVVVKAPTTSIGDAHLGMWAPQDRQAVIRNVVRPGASWRQSHPGLSSTQVMGYYGSRSGRGVLVGTLDRLGCMKDLCAEAGEDTVRMSVLATPPWNYSIGNRPNAFTGATDGDSRDALEAMALKSPWNQQELPDLSHHVPNTRDIEVGGQRSASITTASLGIMRLGRDQLGIQGTVVNTLADLGYSMPFDVAIAPVMGNGPHGWNAIAKLWREIADRPDSAFPLQERRDGDLSKSPHEADIVLDVDTSIHDGQESLVGMDAADLPAAYPHNGVLCDPDVVRDLIAPRDVVPLRTATNTIEVFGNDELVFQCDLLGQGGKPAGIRRSVREDGRGYLRLFGKPNFYIQPEQVKNNDWYQSLQSLGRLSFRSLNPAQAGVKVGDFVKVVSNFAGLEPYGGRASAPIGTDSELFPNIQDDQFRIVLAFGVDSDTLIVGQYRGGVLVPHAFTPVIANSSPQFHFEVEVLREEVNILMFNPVQSGDTVRLQINLPAGTIGSTFPATAIGWAEVVEVDGREHDFSRFLVQDAVAYIEFASHGVPAASFNWKAGRVRRRFAPLDLFSELVDDGDHVIMDGVKVNDRVRVIDMSSTWASNEAKLSNGWLEFARPLADEPPGDIRVRVFDGVPAAGRLLHAAIDIEGDGFRFVDSGAEEHFQGGFRSIVLPGDVLLLENAASAENLEPFEILEVLSPHSLRLARRVVQDDVPAGTVQYRIVRPGRSFHDPSFGGRRSSELSSGPRRILASGQDRVHFLAIGWTRVPGSPITGVFGVDSSSWSELGANPFVPAQSVNITEYETSEWGTRKPSQEFPISGYRDGTFSLARGWAFEPSSFEVTFDDAGPVTLQKNVIQYRVVRDVRSFPEWTDFRGTGRAIETWKTALDATAVMALLRGWQPGIRGFDRPAFTPVRGKYRELLEALDGAGHIHMSAIDLHGLDDGDLYDRMNLIAAAYWNRFGSKSAPSVDAASGETDNLMLPTTGFARGFLLSEVLSELADDGVRSFLLDGLENGIRDDHGSPRFHRPLKDGEGDPTTFEISDRGGGPSIADGWRRVLSAAKTKSGVSQPMDWLIGQSSLSAKDWAEIDHEFPTSNIPFPVGSAFRVPLEAATVVGTTLFIPGVDFGRLSATIYGERVRLQAGDMLHLWPGNVEMTIVSVGVGISLDVEPDIEGIEECSLSIRRAAATDRVAAAPFFRFAFGAYASVAADVTFLASDISWQEVVSQRGTGITEEEYQAAVTSAFGRSMYRIGANFVSGLVPSMRVSSEASRRSPPDRYGHAWTRHGTDTLAEQASTIFRQGGKTYTLIQTHLNYLRYLMAWSRDYESFTRYGENEQSPTVEGATSLLVSEVALSSPGRDRPAVVAGAFRDAAGDILRLFTNWAAPPFSSGEVESVSSTLVFSELGITEGYWTTVEVRRGYQNIWMNDLVDVSDDPDAELSHAFDVRPLELKAYLCYRQNVVVRLNADDVEVDRVLIVPKGRSVAAAFQVIALDLPSSDSGRYVVVVGAGAIADGLVVPSIPGATIQLQNSADEDPTIGDIA